MTLPAPYRLSDDLAKTRMLYPAPAPTFPSLLVVDIAREYRGASLALHRYYPMVVESDEEAREVEHYLTADRLGPRAPDLLDLRPSALIADEIIVALYASPADAWPWARLCRWPPELVDAAEPAASLARGCYTVELFESEGDAIRGTEQLLKTLWAEGLSKIRFLPGELVQAPGLA